MGGELEEMQTTFHREAANLAHRKRMEGMRAGMDYKGGSFAPLKEATIKRKRGEHSTIKVYRSRKGGPSGLATRRAKASATPDSPLIDTGAMLRTRVEADAKEGRVIMARSRSERISKAGSIGRIHHDGTKDIPKREHWGFYPGVRDGVNKRYRRLVSDVMRKATRG